MYVHVGEMLKWMLGIISVDQKNYRFGKQNDCHDIGLKCLSVGYNISSKNTRLLYWHGIIYNITVIVYLVNLMVG